MQTKTVDLESIQISIICPTFFKGDATGHAAHNYYRAVKRLGYSNVRCIGVKNDFDDMPFERCYSSYDLKRNNWVKNSDLIIWHFSIYHEFFEYLRSNKTGRHVVCFHNITPKHLMPVGHWQDLIDRSVDQLSAFHHADAIWADSRENIEELLRNDINNIPILEIPLVVDRPEPMRFTMKPSGRINILCIGRLQPSKGIADIIEAMALLKKKTTNFLLHLIGNPDCSDKKYIQNLLAQIKLHGLGEHINFVGKVSEQTLCFLLKNAHIYVSGSYHEGFCVPVIESLRAGLIPITYDAANLKWIYGGHGRIVETGNIQSLSTAIFETIEGILNSKADPDTKCIPLDNGIVSGYEFENRTTQYTANFSFVKFCSNIETAINALWAMDK